MLRPENVGYAATCNTVGVRTGWNFAYVVLTTLEVLQLVAGSRVQSFLSTKYMSPSFIEYMSSG